MMGLRIWLEARLTTSAGVFGLRVVAPRPLFAVVRPLCASTGLVELQS